MHHLNSDFSVRHWNPTMDDDWTFINPDLQTCSHVSTVYRLVKCRVGFRWWLMKVRVDEWLEKMPILSLIFWNSKFLRYLKSASKAPSLLSRLILVLFCWKKNLLLTKSRDLSQVFKLGGRIFFNLRKGRMLVFHMKSPWKKFRFKKCQNRLFCESLSNPILNIRGWTGTLPIQSVEHTLSVESLKFENVLPRPSKNFHPIQPPSVKPEQLEQFPSEKNHYKNPAWSPPPGLSLARFQPIASLALPFPLCGMRSSHGGRGQAPIGRLPRSCAREKKKTSFERGQAELATRTSSSAPDRLAVLDIVPRKWWFLFLFLFFFCPQKKVSGSRCDFWRILCCSREWFVWIFCFLCSEKSEPERRKACLGMDLQQVVLNFYG